MIFQFVREGRTVSEILFVLGCLILARSMQYNTCVHVINRPWQFDRFIDTLFFWINFKFQKSMNSFRIFISVFAFLDRGDNVMLIYIYIHPFTGWRSHWCIHRVKKQLELVQKLRSDQSFWCNGQIFFGWYAANIFVLKIFR